MPRESKRARFVRLANKRVPKAVAAINLVGNLASRSTYEFNDKDAKAIIKTLKGALAECEARFNGQEVRNAHFRLEE